MLAQELVLNYTNFSKGFVIHFNARDLPLRAVISQDGKLIFCYTRKLNPAQKNYTVGEKEILGIVKRLKGFNNVLRGMEIIVCTDYLNLLYAKNASQQRMARQRLIVEEFVRVRVLLVGVLILLVQVLVLLFRTCCLKLFVTVLV